MYNQDLKTDRPFENCLSRYLSGRWFELILFSGSSFELKARFDLTFFINKNKADRPKIIIHCSKLS